MVSAVDIIVPIVIFFVIVAVSIYLFAMFCHPDERGVGNQLFPKILVILSQTLAWGQILLLPLDLSLSEDGSSLEIAYYIIFSVMLFFVAFLNPFAIFLYEADDSDSNCSKIVWSLLFAGIIGAIWSAGIFISYIWVGVYTFNSIEERIQAPMYIYLIMSLVGWIVLAFNAGIGLIYLPKDLIQYFVYRPHPLTKDEAYELKNSLQQSSSELIALGEKLRATQFQVSKRQGNWFSRKKKQYKFRGQVEDYRKKVKQLQNTHGQFKEQIKVLKVHPARYISSLILGILAIVISIGWFVQLLGTSIQDGNSVLFIGIDGWLSDLSNGDASFVATLIYGILALYIMVCLLKGSIVFGIRIPFILKIHPLEVHKTLMNSLLFNTNLMILASTSVSILCVWAFPTYFAKTYLSTITRTAFNNMPLFDGLYKNRIPQYALLILMGAALLVVIVTVIYRKCKGKQEKAKI